MLADDLFQATAYSMRTAARSHTPLGHTVTVFDPRPYRATHSNPAWCARTNFIVQLDITPYGHQG